jgi:hypothetical protein
MAILIEKVITAFLGSGITATFTSRKDFGDKVLLDILWANNESALDYNIELDKETAQTLINALQAVIEELGK